MTRMIMNVKEKYEVTGMTCNHCAMKVEKALKGVAGVASASVDLASKLAVVEYDADKADSIRLLSAVETAGYQGKKL
jgi:copper chaperone